MLSRDKLRRKSKLQTSVEDSYNNSARFSSKHLTNPTVEVSQIKNSNIDTKSNNVEVFDFLKKDDVDVEENKNKYNDK